MCDKCENSKTTGVPPIHLIPVMNQTTGEFEKMILKVISLMPISNILGDGVETLPNSVQVDSEGKKTVTIGLKFTKEPSLPIFNTPVSITHVFEITKGQLNGISGFDSTTTFKLDFLLDGEPFPSGDVNFEGCSTRCICEWISDIWVSNGGYWFCVCATICKNDLYMWPVRL
jgi:hypothetical protein